MQRFFFFAVLIWIGCGLLTGCPSGDVEGGWVDVENQSGEYINFVEILYVGPFYDSFYERYDLADDKIAPGATRTFRLRYDGFWRVNTRQDVGGWDFNDNLPYVENGTTVVQIIDGV